MSRPRTGAILLAGGRSARMGGIDKTTAALAGLPVVAHSLRAFAACAAIDHIVLVAGPDNGDILARLAAGYGGGKVRAIPPGGARRRDSVAAGLAALPEVDLVAVHDTARPLVTDAMIRRGIDLAARHGAAVVAAAVTDTIKQIGTPAASDGGAHAPARVERTIDRATLRAAQTPQTFRLDLLRRAHAAEPTSDATAEATDDAALVEALPAPVFLYDAEAPNPKITRPQDLTIVEALLRALAECRRRDGGGAAMSPAHDRIGLGSDSHRFSADRPLVLGGVTIPGSDGLAGHSDADVLTHAIIDALLGAAALGDIGTHFPPDDPAWAGADSLDLLRRTVASLEQHGYRVGNVDATVVAERPRLRPHVEAMRARLAAVLAVEPDAVSVKATTAEGLGALGRGEGMQAQAIALIRRRD